MRRHPLLAYEMLCQSPTCGRTGYPTVIMRSGTAAAIARFEGEQIR